MTEKQHQWPMSDKGRGRVRDIIDLGSRGFSLRDIARVSGVSTHTVKQVLYYARVSIIESKTRRRSIIWKALIGNGTRHSGAVYPTRSLALILRIRDKRYPNSQGTTYACEYSSTAAGNVIARLRARYGEKMFPKVRGER